MKIAVDARSLNVPHLRGMGKYLYNLVKGLLAVSEAQIRLFSNRPDWPFFQPQAANADKCKITSKVADSRGYRFRAWEQLILPRLAKKNSCDVLFFPGTGASFWQPVPTIVTIHDTLMWDDPCDTSAIDFLFNRIVYPIAYRKASAIITISTSSKNDILRLWPSLRGKLFIIPHGVDGNYLNTAAKTLPVALASMGLSMPYFLYIGGALPRKRFSWALKVFAELPNSTSLVACGIEKESRDAFLSLLPPAKKNKLYFAPFVDEKEMPALYQNAVATLYPTLYEGFGLPVLESQAVGTPVLFSPLGSLAELVGPGAITLAPHDIKEWVGACKKLLSEWTGEPRPIPEARKWARKFAWIESARKHLTAFEMSVSPSVSNE